LRERESATTPELVFGGVPRAVSRRDFSRGGVSGDEIPILHTLAVLPCLGCHQLSALPRQLLPKSNTAYCVFLPAVFPRESPRESGGDFVSGLVVVRGVV
jgi:hypothetical protein